MVRVQRQTKKTSRGHPRTCLDGPERRLVEPPEQRLHPPVPPELVAGPEPLRLVRRRRPAGEKQQRDEERVGRGRRRSAGCHQCGVLTGSRNLLMQGRFWSSPLLRFSFSQAGGGEEYIGRPVAGYCRCFGARRSLALGVGAAAAPAARNVGGACWPAPAVWLLSDPGASSGGGGESASRCVALRASEHSSSLYAKVSASKAPPGDGTGGAIYYCHSATASQPRLLSAYRSW